MQKEKISRIFNPVPVNGIFNFNRIIKTSIMILPKTEAAKKEEKERIKRSPLSQELFLFFDNLF